MRRILVKQLKPGMTLGSSLLSHDGRVLLQSGVPLRAGYIERLEAMGYTSVYVREPGLEDMEIPQPISEQTRQNAIRALRDTVGQIKTSQTLDLLAVQKAVKSIVDEVLLNREVLIHLGDIRSHDDHTFAHSVNVSMLCALIGKGLGYTPKQIHDLATGGMLHDLGKIFIPPEVLNKPGSLSPEEMDLVKQHPRAGFDMLRHRHEISLLAAHMAYQHHERLDGSGYPRQLKGDEIHPFGQVNAVADTFDAMTVDRPYHNAMSPIQAIGLLHEKSARHYDPKALAVLRSHIAPYPVSARVWLNTGELAVVIAVNRAALDRPIVRVIAEGDRQLDPPFRQLNLKENDDVYITGMEEP